VSEPGSDENGVRDRALARIEEGILALDSEFRCTYINETAQELLDTSAEEALDYNVLELFPDAKESVAHDALLTAVESGEEATYERYNAALERWFRARVFPDETGASVVFVDVTEEKHRQTALRRLHEVTREMLAAESEQEVADLVCEATGDILDMPLNGVHLYDESTGALEPVAQSAVSREVIGQAPALDGGIAWEAFERGEVRAYRDVRDAPDVFNDETPARSEIVVPLDEFGVFIVSSDETGAFDASDEQLARVLGANATAALRQVTTASRLAAQRDDLELVTEMLSHDIRNDLQVIEGSAELLTGAVGDDDREHLDRIKDRTGTAMSVTETGRDLVEAIQRSGSDTEPVPLGTVLDAAVSDARAGHEALTVRKPDDIPTVEVAADDLLDSVFRNLLGNVADHAGDSPTARVDVSVHDDRVTVHVVDDGPGVPPAVRESLFDRGATGPDGGTGTGLYLVRRLVGRYGGDVRVSTDEELGGADFAVELRRA